MCSLPPEPENGGYVCHPRPCRDPLNSGSVIEYLCAEGYVLKGDYKYLTCKNGEWKPAMEISCHLNEGQFGRWERGSVFFLTQGKWQPFLLEHPVLWGSLGPLMPCRLPFFGVSCLGENIWGCWCVSHCSSDEPLRDSVALLRHLFSCVRSLWCSWSFVCLAKSWWPLTVFC